MATFPGSPVLIQHSLPPGHKHSTLTPEEHEYLKLESVRRVLLHRTPRNADELYTYFGRVHGFWIAHENVCPDHGSPMEFLALVFFEAVTLSLAMAAKSSGKAIPTNTLILTPDGWVKMGDLSVGDAVVAGDGTATIITAIYPQGEVPIFKLTFQDGSTAECCDDHLWRVQSTRQRASERRWAKRRVSLSGRHQRWKRKPGFSVLSLKEMRQHLVVSGAANWSIPLVGPVSFKAKPVPLDPYLLGLLLGDGGLSRPSMVMFSTADEWIEQAVKRVLPAGAMMRRKAGHDYLIIGTANVNPVLNALRGLGVHGHLSRTKFIPQQYLWNSPDIRLAVLQGLMDTDGTIDARNGHASFSSTSDDLAAGMEFLVRSLGGVTYRRRKMDSWDLTISMPNGVDPFRLPRKAARIKQKTWHPPARYLKTVESVGPRPAQCITVAHPSGLYVADEFIVTHNTQDLALLHIANSRFKPGCWTAHMGATQKQADRAYSYFQTEVTKPYLRDELDGDPLKVLSKFKNTSRVEVLTGTISQASGPHESVGTVDELDQLDWDVWQHFNKTPHEANGIKAQLVLASTRFLKYGTVNRVIESLGSHLKVVPWCVWEAMAPCPHDCLNSPMGGKCPLYSRETIDDNGDAQEEIMCGGRAHEATGHLTYDEVMSSFLVSDALSFDILQALKEPGSEGMFFPEANKTVHVKAEYEYVAGRPVYLGYDDGFEWALCLGAWQLREDGMLYQFDEIYEARALPAAVCETLATKPWLADVELGWPDPNGRAAIETYRQFFLKVLDRGVMSWKTDNARVDGWRAVRRRLRPPIGRPLLGFHPRCLNTWNDLAGLQKLDGTEDCQKKQDHGADQVRYLVFNLERHLGLAEAWSRDQRPSGALDKEAKIRELRDEAMIRQRWDRLRQLGMTEAQLKAAEARFAGNRAEFAKGLGGWISEYTLGGRLRRAGLAAPDEEE